MKIGRYIVAVIVLVCLYSGYWYLEASHIEREVKKEIENSEKYGSITYDAIEKRGYPFTIQIALKNPKITNPALSYSLNGTLNSTWSLIGNLREIGMTGKSRAQIQGEQYSLEGDTVAEIESLRTIGDKGSITIRDGVAYAPENDQHGPFHWMFDIVNIHYDVRYPSIDRLHVDLDLILKGAECKPEQAADPYQAFTDTLCEKCGKTNTQLSITCDVPSAAKIQEFSNSPMRILSEMLPSISVQLKKFDTENLLSVNTWNASLNVHEGEDKNIILELSSNGLTRYQKAYHEAILSGIDSAAKVSKNWQPEADMQGVKDLLEHHQDTLKAAIPNPEDLGDIKFSETLFFELNKSTFNWHVALKNLSCESEKFGITVHADAQNRNNSDHVDIHAKLREAHAVIRQLVETYNKLQPVLNIVTQDPAGKYQPLPPDAPEKIYTFFTRFGVKEGNDGLDFHCTYHDGVVHIGNLTLQEVRELAEATWADITQKQEKQ